VTVLVAIAAIWCLGAAAACLFVAGAAKERDERLMAVEVLEPDWLAVLLETPAERSGVDVPAAAPSPADDRPLVP
jgi:hypothetical protein